MQLTPATAKGIAQYTHGTKFQLSDLDEPRHQRPLRHVVPPAAARPLPRRAPALAAYNAGQANVDSWIALHEGIQFSQTRAYVDKVESLKKLYRRVYASELGYVKLVGPAA